MIFAPSLCPRRVLAFPEFSFVRLALLESSNSKNRMSSRTPLCLGYRIVALPVLALIMLYRMVSPVKQLLFGPFARCRFHPTCSEYALECFRSLPLPMAFQRSLLRVLRCNPLHPGGHDPVFSEPENLGPPRS